ncbi:MAG: rhodanese-like domain-containing protein [Methanothrix sp.]|nr:rhodanese-like domain-containing protein [Methanothrix sp.]
MTEKLGQDFPANDRPQASGKECSIKLLSPAQCRDLIARISGPKCGGTSSEEGSLLILDVRTAPEYRAGHLKGSINLDIRSPSFADELEALERGRAYLVYCRSGVRSSRAVSIMRSLGFRELYDLAGGLVGWQREGFGVSSNAGMAK